MCMALVSKRLEAACFVRNWTLLDGLKLRAVVYVSDTARPQEAQAILAGTREASGLVLVLCTALFQAPTRTCFCYGGAVKVWRRIVLLVWVTS